MNSIRSCAVAAAVAGLMVSAQSAAETARVAAPVPQAPAGKAQDPNEVICQKLESTGSRLSSRRVCMTRARWAEAQLQDRQEVERVQVRRGMIGE